MLNLIKVNENNKSYASKFLKSSLDNVYIINNNNANLGIIEYKENDGFYKVDLIEVEKPLRNKGIGKEVIKTLLKTGDVIGDSLQNIKTINFWEQLGAEFEEDIEECIENNCCIPFIIYQE